MYANTPEGNNFDGYVPEKFDGDGGGPNDSTMDSSGMMAYLQHMPMDEKEKKAMMDAISFDENAIPPNLDTAYNHRNCNLFGKVMPAFDVEAVKMCPCCCSVQRVSYGLCESAISMDYDGPSIPQFFYLSQNLIWLSFLLFVLAAPIQFWIVSDNCSSVPGGTLSNCQFNLKVFLDSNLVTKDGNYDKFSRFYFLVIWVGVLVFFIFYHKREALLSALLKKRKAFVSNYSVMIHDVVVPDEVDRFYLQEVLADQQRTADDGTKLQLNIEELDVGKFEGNIDHFLRLIEEKHQTVSALQRRLNIEPETKKIKVLEGKLKTSQTQLDKARADLAKIRAGLANPKNGFQRRNIAFVTLQNPKMAQSIQTTSLLRWTLSRTPLISCCFKKKVHFVEPAIEPDDVIWTSIGYSFFTRLRAAFLSYVAFFFVLLACFAIQFGSKLLAGYLQTNYGSNKVKTTAIGLIPAITAQVLNFFLVGFTQYLSQFERKLSQTEYLLTLTRKLIYMQVLNAAGFPLLLSFVRKEYGGVENLSQQIFSTLLTNIFLNPLLHMFNPGYMLRAVKRYYISMRLRMGSEVLMTQKELNEMFAPPDMSMQVRYASVVRTFFISCFFLEIVPSGPLLCALFMCFQYLIDKYMVVRRYSRMIRLNELLPYGISGIAELSAFFIVLGHIILGYRYLHEMENQEFQAFYFIFDAAFLGGALVMGILGVTTFYPIYSMTKKQEEPEKFLDPNSSFASLAISTKFMDENSPEMQEGFNDYRNQRINFDTEYNRANPITKTAALRDWAREKYGAEFPDETNFETAGDAIGAFSHGNKGGEGTCINPFADEAFAPPPGDDAPIVYRDGAAGDDSRIFVGNVIEGTVGDISYLNSQRTTNLANQTAPMTEGRPTNLNQAAQIPEKNMKQQVMMERLLAYKLKLG